MNDLKRIEMTYADFGVCLAALIQAESYWDFQLKSCDGDMPGDFTREEVAEILRSLNGVRSKVEDILQMSSGNKSDNHTVVS